MLSSAATFSFFLSVGSVRFLSLSPPTPSHHLSPASQCLTRGATGYPKRLSHAAPPRSCSPPNAPTNNPVTSRGRHSDPFAMASRARKTPVTVMTPKSSTAEAFTHPSHTILVTHPSDSHHNSLLLSCPLLMGNITCAFIVLKCDLDYHRCSPR